MNKGIKNSPILKTRASFLTAPSKQLNLVGVFDENVTYRQSDVFSAPAILDAVAHITKTHTPEQPQEVGVTEEWVKEWVNGNFIPTTETDFSQAINIGTAGSSIYSGYNVTCKHKSYVGSAVLSGSTASSDAELRITGNNTGNITLLTTDQFLFTKSGAKMELRGADSSITVTGSVVANIVGALPSLSPAYSGTRFYGKSMELLGKSPAGNPNGDGTITMNAIDGMNLALKIQGLMNFPFLTATNNMLSIRQNGYVSSQFCEIGHSYIKFSHGNGPGKGDGGLILMENKNSIVEVNGSVKANAVVINGNKTKIATYTTTQFTGIVVGATYGIYRFGPVELRIVGYSTVAYEIRIGLKDGVGGLVGRTLYSSTAGVAGLSFTATGSQIVSVGIPQLWADQMPGILHINCNTTEGLASFKVNFASGNPTAGITKGTIQIEGTYENREEYTDIDEVFVIDPEA